jgi:hypothetical protein
MTFDDYIRKMKGDPWDPSHPARKVDRPRFARVVGNSLASGRVVVVTRDLGDGLVEAKTLTGRSITRVFHEIELVPSNRA